MPDSAVFAPLVDHQAQEVTADKDYDTDENHQKLKRRGPRERPNLERKFAEQKQYHGLSRARYWGLAKVTIQVLITCLVVNWKENL